MSDYRLLKRLGVSMGAGAAAAAVAGYVSSRWLFIVTVHGSSMVPVLSDGDRRVARRTKRFRRGNLVVFGAPRAVQTDDLEWLVKMVASVTYDLAGKSIVEVRGTTEQSWDSRHFGNIRGDQIEGVLFETCSRRRGQAAAPDSMGSPSVR